LGEPERLHLINRHILSKIQDGRDSSYVADEIQHLNVTLSRPQAQTPAELLYEDPPAVGDPSETNNVHVRDIYSLVQDVDSGDDRDITVTEAQ
jgi:hypothetical protein